MQQQQPFKLSWFIGCGGALAALGLAACTTRTPAPVVEGPRPSAPVLTQTPPPVTAPVTAAPSPGATTGSKFHVVQRGETLYRIALNNHIDVSTLMAWNDMAPGQSLREGQVLRLEPPTGAPTALAETGAATGAATTGVATVMGAGATQALQGQPLPSESLPAPGLSPVPVPLNEVPGSASPVPAPSTAPLLSEPKAQRLPYSDGALASLQGSAATTATTAPAVENNAITPPATPATPAANVVADVKPSDGAEKDGVTWSWPTTGKVASSFNEKAPMKGIDITTNAGAPVVAAARGKVIYIGKEPRGLGQMVVISHANQTVSVYFHTDKITVKEQQQVTLGQRIAEVAATTGGNKLHFEVRRQGRPLDPVSVLPQR